MRETWVPMEGVDSVRSCTVGLLRCPESSYLQLATYMVKTLSGHEILWSFLSRHKFLGVSGLARLSEAEAGEIIPIGPMYGIYLPTFTVKNQASTYR